MRPKWQTQNITNDTQKNVTFDLHKGQILGFTAWWAPGNRSRTGSFGLDAFQGKVLIDGEERRLGSVRRAIKSGITMIPEEGRVDGIFGILSIRENVPIMKMKNVLKNRVIDRHKERRLAQTICGNCVWPHATKNRACHF